METLPRLIDQLRVERHTPDPGDRHNVGDGMQSYMTQRIASYNVTKRNFRELIDRVGDGERIVIARRGTPVMAVVLRTR